MSSISETCPPPAVSRPHAAAGRTAIGRRIRQDVQGLRALAVVVVILDHLFRAPSGGFIGVDIFFAISGYLITGMLLEEASSAGQISFRDFYLRRAKRILPAAMLVLSVTVCAGSVIYNVGEARSIADDAGWAAGFAANWRFAMLGTDYLHAGASVSPVQHYWSLGVEEQFYALWPWILLLALAATRRFGAATRSSRTLSVLAAIGTMIVASFAFAIAETRSEATTAYFSTFTRAWEFGAGALVAICAPGLRRLGPVVRWLMCWAGLVGIGISLFAIDVDTPFPGPWAAAPVLGAVLVIASGVADGDEDDRGYQRMAWPLTNAISRYVGKISYSLYLWHFPVIVLGASVLHRDSGLRYYSAVLLLTAVLSVGTFHLVEEPVRRGHRIKARAIALASITAVIAPLGLYAYASYQAAASVDGDATRTGLPRLPSREEWIAALPAALRAKDWPKLMPDPAHLGPEAQAAKAPEWVSDGCLGGALAAATYKSADPVENAKHCVYGNPNASKTMIVFGDSTTISYVPGIRAALAGQDWRILVYTVAACAPTYVPASRDSSVAECIAFKSWVFSEIKRIHPAVVVSSISRTDAELEDEATQPTVDAAWKQQLTDTARQVLTSADSYVLLAAPELVRSEPAVCITRFSHPADCASPLSDIYKHHVASQAQALAAVGDSRAKFVDTSTWFCTNDKCPAFAAGILIRADRLHLTAVASKVLAPFLREALVGG